MLVLKSGWQGDRLFPEVGQKIRVRADKLRWPATSDASKARFGGNNLYRDLRGKTWHQVGRIMLLEDAIFERLLNDAHLGASKSNLQRQINRAGMLCDELDFGVISAVYAISAGGGIPVSSCNGGCMSRDHSEPHPVIAFNWPLARLKIARECAREAGVAMWVHRYGELVIAGDRIGRMLLFADALYRRRSLLQGNSG